MLKYRIASLNDVDEAFRSLYRNDGQGGYILDVEGAVDKSKLDEFRNNNIELQRKIESGEATLTELRGFREQFGGLNPDDIKEALETQRRAQEKELIDKKDFEGLIAARTADMKKGHDSELARFRSELEKASGSADAYKNQYTQLLIESQVLDAIGEIGVLRQGAKADVLNRARSTWTLGEDGKLVAMSGQDPLYSAEDATKPMAMSEWAKSLALDAGYLFESTVGMGSQGSGQGNGSQGQRQGFVSRGDEAGKSSNIEAIAAGKVLVR